MTNDSKAYSHTRVLPVEAVLPLVRIAVLLLLVAAVLACLPAFHEFAGIATADAFDQGVTAPSGTLRTETVALAMMALVTALVCPPRRYRLRFVAGDRAHVAAIGPRFARLQRAAHLGGRTRRHLAVARTDTSDSADAAHSSASEGTILPAPRAGASAPRCEGPFASGTGRTACGSAFPDGAWCRPCV